MAHKKIYFYCNLVKTKFEVPMKNYLLANFRLHHFKKVWATGSWQIFANPWKFSSYLCQKKKLFTLQNVFFFPISNCCYYIWPSLMFSTVYVHNDINHLKTKLCVNYFSYAASRHCCVVRFGGHWLDHRPRKFGYAWM